MQEEELQLLIIKSKENHVCPICGKACGFHSHSSKKNPRWNLFCSNECKYSPLGKQIMNFSIRRTKEEKYSSHEEYVKKTNEKRKQTNLEKFGTDNPFKSKEIKDKIRRTNIERYGVENPNQNKDILKKRKQTNLERYGVENPFQSKEIKEKILKTSRTIRYNYFLKKLELKKIIPLFGFEDYVSTKSGEKRKFKCEQCGNEFELEIGKTNFEIRKIRCPNSIHKTSSCEERAVGDWIESYNILIERNKKFFYGLGNSFEADIYIPEYKLAIEYNGLYWHSNLNHDKNYHYNKWKFFKEQNIDCIQIFENEWRDKQEIVKSIIKNHLSLNEKIYARKCIIKEISNNEYELFLEQNHIQGYCNARIKLGLYYNDELVEVMSFSKPRFNKKYDWENIRTCTKIGYNVVGGFSKLLNFFRKNYKGSIVSYIDSRYFNGNGYIKNGFQNIGHSYPNYFYFKTQENILYNRIEFQKHKLKDKLEIYDENLSEKENMFLNNYLLIYDCGNDIMVYKKK